MPNKSSAEKSLRQDKKRRSRNMRRKTAIKDSIKDLDAAIHENDRDSAEKALSSCFKSLDKAAAKGAIHKKTASRKKGRLSSKVERTLS